MDMSSSPSSASSPGESSKVTATDVKYLRSQGGIKGVLEIHKAGPAMILVWLVYAISWTGSGRGTSRLCALVENYRSMEPAETTTGLSQLVLQVEAQLKHAFIRLLLKMLFSQGETNAGLP